jgi:hypothetical protein
VRILICIVITCAALGDASAKDWRGLTPLHSTRSDVDRLLGTPTNKNNADAAVYRTETEEVLVRYSTGTCIEKWNVPGDVILFIHVFPQKRPKLSELNLNISKYKITKDPEALDYSNYANDEEGFGLDVNTVDSLVHIFIYYPSAKEDKLRCSSP